MNSEEGEGLSSQNWSGSLLLVLLLIPSSSDDMSSMCVGASVYIDGKCGKQTAS
jgi:hypothetical protein